MNRNSNKFLKDLGKLCVKQDGDLVDISWNHWASYFDSNVSLRLFSEFGKVVKPFSGKVDYFCPIPNSGQPLIPIVMKATGLSAITYPRSYNLTLNDFEHEDKIRRNPSVLLVDTNINLGESFSRAVKQLERISASIAAFAVIVFNDTNLGHMPKGLLELYGNGKLIFLYKVSDIMRAKDK